MAKCQENFLSNNKMKTTLSISTIALFTLLVFGFTHCKKKETPKDPERGGIKDVQGNNYETVKIGEDWWMTQNLKVRVFNDSTPLVEISEVVDDSLWSKNYSPAFCVLDERYGAVYNWYALSSSKNLSPKGWHVATEEDWQSLETNLGLTSDELMQTGWRGNNVTASLFPDNSTGWPSSENQVFGTNRSGFYALPGGCRVFNGKKGEVSVSGYWWTSTTVSATEAYYRNLNVAHRDIFKYHADKRYAFSIRCVKDR
jgi:uncharacterized protein (TIGR02145 family)